MENMMSDELNSIQSDDDNKYTNSVSRVRPDLEIDIGKNERHTVPFLAPPPPAQFVGRENLITEIKKSLFDPNPPSILVLGTLPGVGKTALAAQLVHGQDILKHFRDGVLWVGLGQQPHLSAQMDEWLLALGVEFSEILGMDSLEDRQKAIQNKIGQRRMLLVLDDVWDVEHVQWFSVKENSNCVHLITTRRQKVIDQLPAAEIKSLPSLDLSDGLQLLAQLAPQAVQAEPEIAAELVRKVWAMPLALVQMGK
jgi:hypothetical protein